MSVNDLFHGVDLMKAATAVNAVSGSKTKGVRTCDVVTAQAALRAVEFQSAELVSIPGRRVSVCPKCQSFDVGCSAGMKWNFTAQQWVVDEINAHAWCNACGAIFEDADRLLIGGAK